MGDGKVDIIFQPREAGVVSSDILAGLSTSRYGNSRREMASVVPAMGDNPRHIRRSGILLHLSPVSLAYLCPCRRCAELVELAALARAERDRRMEQFNPPCPFCGYPTIWRGVAYVCPYRETPGLHRQVRALRESERKRQDDGREDA